jgi:uncharacterized protein (DUF58 family)
LRGIEVERRLPPEWVAEQPARVVLEIRNAQRRVWSHAIRVEDQVEIADSGEVRAAGTVFALRIAPRGREARSYAFAAPRRGELQFRGLRVTTRFPFGLFAKSLWLERPAVALVYPRLTPCPAPAAGETQRPLGRERTGRSALPSEVTGLRGFARGDSVRRVHWPASWRRGVLLVRDAEGEAAGETEVWLATGEQQAGPGFEAEVERAASQTEAGLRAGLRVGLRTDHALLRADRGPVHRARLLGYLAMVRPDGAES